jgi:hypothetical protein
MSKISFFMLMDLIGDWMDVGNWELGIGNYLKLKFPIPNS